MNLAPKVEVTMVRKDFGLAARTYPLGTVTTAVENNVYNPITNSIEKDVAARDTRIIGTSISVFI